MQMPISVKWLSAIFCIVAVGLAVIYRSNPVNRSGLDLSYLGEDAYFSIGGENLVLPNVVVILHPTTYRISLHRSPGMPATKFQPRFKAEYGDPNSPRKTGKIAVPLYHFGEIMPRGGTKPHCNVLARQWARDICHGKKTGRMKSLPRSFVLLDHEGFVEISVGLQSASKTLFPGSFLIDCDKTLKVCSKAVLAITPGLYALWDVFPSNNSERAAREQAQAIFQLVKYGFGDVEDFPRVIAEK